MKSKKDVIALITKGIENLDLAEVFFNAIVDGDPDNLFPGVDLTLSFDFQTNRFNVITNSGELETWYPDDITGLIV